MVAKEVFVICYNFNPFAYSLSQKGNFHCILYKTIRGQGLGRSGNSDLQLREAGAKRNIYGSTTLWQVQMTYSTSYKNLLTKPNIGKNEPDI